MYLFAFSRFAGIDKVILVDDRFLPAGISAGDLLKSGEEFFLVLGEQVCFSEQYTQGWTPTSSFDVVFSGFLSERMMQLLHWMVEEWYSTYKSVLPYFLPEMDLDRVLQKQVVLKKNIVKNNLSSIDAISQTLIVFPDMRSMMMLATDGFRGRGDVVVLSSKDGEAKKIRDWRAIKTGAVRVVLATHAEVFQDFFSCTRICLVDPHTRYYINTQDPRYKIDDVLGQLGSLWGIQVENIESQGHVLFDEEKTGK